MADRRLGPTARLPAVPFTTDFQAKLAELTHPNISEDNLMTTHFTAFDPQRIAIEAAEDATRLLSVVCDPEQDGSLCFDYSAITATLHPLILSAAAKMVQQSGAVAALESCGEAIYRGDTYQHFDEQKVHAALQSLRSISDGAGK